MASSTVDIVENGDADVVASTGPPARAAAVPARVGPAAGSDWAAVHARERSLFKMGLALLAGAAVEVLSVLVHSVLPAKYFYDSLTLSAIIHQTTPRVPDPQYLATADFYKAVGLGNNQSLAAIIAVTMFAAMCAYAVMATGSARLRPSTYVIYAVSVVWGSVYLAQYSKESVVLVAIALCLAGTRFRHGYWVIVASLVLYASLFRSYWFLVVALFVAIDFLLKRRVKPRTLVLFLLVSFIATGVLINLLDHEGLDTFRQGANLYRANPEDAITQINAFVTGFGTLWDGIVNAVITFVALLFPWPLVLLATPFYLVITVVIVVVSARSIEAVRMLLDRRDHEFPFLDNARRTPSVRWVVALLIAYTFVQSLFEPDFGSRVKHLTPLLPLVLYVCAAADRRKTDADRPQPALGH